jgi:hypothetical protein
MILLLNLIKKILNLENLRLIAMKRMMKIYLNIGKRLTKRKSRSLKKRTQILMFGWKTI